MAALPALESESYSDLESPTKSRYHQRPRQANLSLAKREGSLTKCRTGQTNGLARIGPTSANDLQKVVMLRVLKRPLCGRIVLPKGWLLFSLICSLEYGTLSEFHYCFQRPALAQAQSLYYGQLSWHCNQIYTPLRLIGYYAIRIRGNLWDVECRDTLRTALILEMFSH